jgi:DNA gyrase/topoisomerase IV subunit A
MPLARPYGVDAWLAEHLRGKEVMPQTDFLGDHSIEQVRQRTEAVAALVLAIEHFSEVARIESESASPSEARREIARTLAVTEQQA